RRNTFLLIRLHDTCGVLGQKDLPRVIVSAECAPHFTIAKLEKLRKDGRVDTNCGNGDADLLRAKMAAGVVNFHTNYSIERSAYASNGGEIPRLRKGTYVDCLEKALHSIINQILYYQNLPGYVFLESRPCHLNEYALPRKRIKFQMGTSTREFIVYSSKNRLVIRNTSNTSNN
ncbi:unnamed protein product, partial [Nesidiocoris tenuis]